MIDENRTSLVPYFYDGLTGKFKRGETIPVYTSIYFIKDIFLVDIDQNGFLDIVVVGFSNSNIAKLTFIINRKGILDTNPQLHVSMKILNGLNLPMGMYLIL